MTRTANKPLQTISDGTLKATVWLNEGKKGPFYSIQFSRLYEDERGNLQDSSTFNRGDLLQIARLAHIAYDEIEIHRKENRS